MSYLPFVVRGSDAGVEGWSSQRLPFEPKGWMLEYRTALREELRRLDSATRPVLVASFTSPDRRPCDVENVLLYNVGLSPFAHLSCEEVVLTRSFNPPVAPPDGDAGTLVYHHRYQLAPEAPPPAPGQVVARFPAIALRRPVTVEKVWYDLRTSGELVAEQSLRAGASGYVGVQPDV